MSDYVRLLIVAAVIAAGVLFGRDAYGKLRNRIG